VEPRAQYTRTRDGVSIAFWAIGEGTPLVLMPSMPVSHIEYEWQIPEWRAWYESLAERRRVVRYDGRGTGLSDRRAIEYSMDTLEADLEAVVDRLGLDSFALLAAYHPGPAAIKRQPAEGRGFRFKDRGMFMLRGFEDPVRLFEVGWSE
jgi:hypothetical protein